MARYLALCIALLALVVWEAQAAVQDGNGDPLLAQKRWSRGAGYLHPADCGPRCSYRCSATSHKKPCMFFCQKCCAKCLCVPPGTYGNKQACPCYNNWKTQSGGPKCP